MTLTIIIPFNFGSLLIIIILAFSPVVANIINLYDKLKNFYYIKKAQKKLKIFKPKIIAITGSNGKTSVKNILLKMLSKKYITYATPSSYNTPLGISKFINESLDEKCEFLILEYGARNRNDIKNLCKIFGADYGIVTTIAPQHLESFKNIENIYKSKYELVRNLKENFAVFNLDNLYTYRMFYKTTIQKTGVSLFTKSNLYANNIKIKNLKTSFDFYYENKKFSTTTNLLGNHNITNILLACAMAIHLNVDLSDIKKTISELEFSPHRLQLIKSHINILDDSYNCSIESGKCAISVLKQLSGTKMLVTPGIIEGGKNQGEINEKLMSFCKDLNYVVIVGFTNKNALIRGLEKINFCKKNILFASTLDDAKEYFKLLKPNDSLLLLNDLPDDYN